MRHILLLIIWYVCKQLSNVLEYNMDHLDIFTKR